jgi:hypothetical protein
MTTEVDTRVNGKKIIKTDRVRRSGMMDPSTLATTTKE